MHHCSQNFLLFVASLDLCAPIFLFSFRVSNKWIVFLKVFDIMFCLQLHWLSSCLLFPGLVSILVGGEDELKFKSVQS